MLNAMVKRMVLEMAGGDMVYDSAKILGNWAVAEWREQSGKVKGAGGFELDRFPQLWGRMVYLALNHGVVFSSGQWTVDENFPSDNDVIVKKVLAQAMGKAFALTVTIPYPQPIG
jgi:hypothetical protein